MSWFARLRTSWRRRNSLRLAAARGTALPLNGSVIAMPDIRGREHFIPLRRDELVEWLCADDAITPDDRDQFRRFCRQLAAASHFRFTRRFEELNKAYDPFDPDT